MNHCTAMQPALSKKIPLAPSVALLLGFLWEERLQHESLLPHFPLLSQPFEKACLLPAEMGAGAAGCRRMSANRGALYFHMRAA